MRLKTSLRVWHAALVLLGFVAIWLLQYSSLSSKKVLTSKGYVTRDLDAVLEKLGKKLEFDPWNDASKQESTDVKLNIEEKSSYTDEELTKNERYYLDHKFNHTHPLTATKLHIFYQTRLTKEEATQPGICLF